MTDAEIKEAEAEAGEKEGTMKNVGREESGQRSHLDARKIDADSFAKDGISQALG